MYVREFNANFSVEMTRSVQAILCNWETPRPQQPELGVPFRAEYAKITLTTYPLTSLPIYQSTRFPQRGGLPWTSVSPNNGDRSITGSA
jgi:hypothetical protein